MRLLVEVGLLRPDGTPAFAPGGPESPMAPAEEPAADPGGNWTPHRPARQPQRKALDARVAAQVPSPFGRGVPGDGHCCELASSSHFGIMV